jgi:dTDP-4-dehydrorhamnose reductase
MVGRSGTGPRVGRIGSCLSVYSIGGRFGSGAGKLGYESGVCELVTDQTAAPTPKRRRASFTAVEIADQIDTVRGWISHGVRTYEIRRRCAEEWGLQTRAAENRIQEARRAMVRDLDRLDRKELASQLIETLLKVQEQALDTRQGSNAIGASRLISELTGLLGRSA